MDKKAVHKFRKINKKLCPSGMWDNGLYCVSDEFVEIPDTVFRDAIIEDRHPEGVVGPCKCISVLGKSWLVKAQEVL